MYSYRNVRSLFMVLILILLSSLMAETVYLNDLKYDKIEDQWYLVGDYHQFRVDDNIISVLFLPSTTEPERQALIQSTGCTIVRTNILNIVDLDIPQNSDPLEMVSIYLNSGLVEIAEPSSLTSRNSERRFNNFWFSSLHGAHHG